MGNLRDFPPSFYAVSPIYFFSTFWLEWDLMALQRFFFQRVKEFMAPAASVIREMI